MSIRCSSTSLISGAIVCGVPGLGVLGSAILATTGSGGSGPGILFNDVQAGDDNKEFRAEVLTWPTAGTIDLQEDGRFTYAGPSADALSYRLWVDGVSIGTASVSLYGALAGVTLGAGSDATATADAGGAALFAYTLGAGADAVATADAGGGIASGLLLGAGADSMVTVDAGGAALFAYALGAAADAVRAADAGGVLLSADGVWVFASVDEKRRWTASNRHRGVALRPDVVGPLRLDEEKVAVFDLRFDLPVDVAVSAVTVEIRTLHGTDAAPALVLVGAPVVNGTEVQQRVRGMVARCLYGLRAVVVDVAGGRHVVDALLPCE